MASSFVVLPLVLLLSGVTAQDSKALVGGELSLVQVGAQHAKKPGSLHQRHRNWTRGNRALTTGSSASLQGHRAPDDPLAPPKNAAEATGVEENAAEDGAAFIAALIVNIVIILVFMCVFMNLRHNNPLQYQNNVTLGTAPTACLGSTKEEVQENLSARWGWWRASMGTTTDEVADTRGLDMAMLLEFSNLGMRVMARIGVPMILIIGPMNCAFGGQPAWAIGDYLSSLSFGNVENGSWLYWVHAFVIWYVVIVVQVSLYGAQKDFLEKRFKWLHTLADKRALTVLVERIPDEFRSDDKLKSFFGSIFNDRNIASAYVVKNTADLTRYVRREAAAEHGLKEAMAKWEKNGKAPEKRPRSWALGDCIEYYTAELEVTKKAINEERTKIKKESPEVGGVNCHSGFVTFKERKYAEMAVTQLYSADRDEWCVDSCPPEPMDLIWSDLQRPANAEAIRTVAGYACVVGLYFAYMPLVIGITKLAVSFDGGPIWAAFAPTLGLQVMVGFLPTFLILIFRNLFTLKADARAQKKLQTMYFWFQIVFVVLVTAIGNSVVDFTVTLFTDPFSLPELLGETMPGATHFYMNFLVLQWVTHAQNLMRIVMLMKFKAFSVLHEESEALRLSEPEDQDYYGIGSRSARFTINMVLGVVFGTLSPGINFLCWVNFAICRVVYGYLIPFAEIKKPDLGGAFWVEQLEHLFVGNIIYCIVMTGVLQGRADVTGYFQPATISAFSLVYVIWSMRRFETAFSWEKLPITKVLAGEKTQTTLKGEYVQPDLFPEKFN